MTAAVAALVEYIRAEVADLHKQADEIERYLKTLRGRK